MGLSFCNDTFIPWITARGQRGPRPKSLNKLDVFLSPGTNATRKALGMNNATDPQPPLPSAQSSLDMAIRIELERLATISTAYSSERSLKSWIQTTVSLYTFGFALAKFFDYLALGQTGLQTSAGPQWLGFALVVTGIVGLMLGTVQYLRRLATMSNLGLSHYSSYLLPAVTAAMLSLIGVATAINISMN